MVRKLGANELFTFEFGIYCIGLVVYFVLDGKTYDDSVVRYNYMYDEALWLDKY